MTGPTEEMLTVEGGIETDAPERVARVGFEVTETAEADARLIAAAPDLLALVLEMFAESEKGMAMLGMPMLSANWHNKAKTVIASTMPNANVTGIAPGKD